MTGGTGDTHTRFVVLLIAPSQEDTLDDLMQIRLGFFPPHFRALCCWSFSPGQVLRKSWPPPSSKSARLTPSRAFTTLTMMDMTTGTMVSFPLPLPCAFFMFNLFGSC